MSKKGDVSNPKSYKRKTKVIHAIYNYNVNDAFQFHCVIDSQSAVSRQVVPKDEMRCSRLFVGEKNRQKRLSSQR